MVLLLSILALGIVGISRNRKLSAVEVKKAVKRESQFEMDWDSTEGDNDTVSELKVPLPGIFFMMHFITRKFIGIYVSLRMNLSFIHWALQRMRRIGGTCSTKSTKKAGRALSYYLPMKMPRLRGESQMALLSLTIIGKYSKPVYFALISTIPVIDL